MVGNGERGVGRRVLRDEPDPGQLRAAGGWLPASHLDRPRGRGQQAGGQGPVSASSSRPRSGRRARPRARRGWKDVQSTSRPRRLRYCLPSPRASMMAVMLLPGNSAERLPPCRRRRRSSSGRGTHFAARAGLKYTGEVETRGGREQAGSASYRQGMTSLRNGLRQPHWIAIDVACTVLLAGVYGVEFNQPADLTGVPQGVAALIVAVAVLPAAARRRWPRTALALVVAGGAAVAALRLFARSAAGGRLGAVPDPAAVRPPGSLVAAGRLVAGDGGRGYRVRPGQARRLPPGGPGRRRACCWRAGCCWRAPGCSATWPGCGARTRPGCGSRPSSRPASSSPRPGVPIARNGCASRANCTTWSRTA